MIRVAIIEDEKKHSERLNACLQHFGKERKKEFSVDFFEDGLNFVSDYHFNYDIVFLDIELPHMNGMECAFRLRRLDSNVVIVFVTNMVQYAVKGYEVGAMGFVVKPIEYFAFTILMDKVVEKIESDTTQDVFIGSGDQGVRISSRDIYYVEVIDHYLIYHTAEGDFRVTGKLADTELRLGDVFFRCSKCYLVNLRHVKEINESEITVGKDKIYISRRRKKDFLIALNGFFGRGGAI